MTPPHDTSEPAEAAEAAEAPETPETPEASGQTGHNGPDQPPGPDPDRDVVLDAKSLRALAHPMRVELLGMLRKHGPSTATRLAQRLGVNSGAASYHLRQLDAAGFVEEDTERGNARDRWWRSRHRTTWFHNELAVQEPEAAMTYFESVLAMDMLRARRVIGGFATMPSEWQEVVDLSSLPLRLTAEEADALRKEVCAVIARYRRDGVADAGGVPEGAERVTVGLHMLPELDTESAPGDAS